MRYDNTSKLYLPHALGKVIGGEYVPDKGIKWPREADNAAGLIQAVGSVTDYAGTSFDQGGAVNPPAMVQIAALQATLESTTGVSLGQLVSLAQSISSLKANNGPGPAAALKRANTMSQLDASIVSSTTAPATGCAEPSMSTRTHACRRAAAAAASSAVRA